MKLSYFSRTVGKKGEINRLRREGYIPAVVYGKNHTPEAIFIKKEEFDALSRQIRTGLMATKVMELHDEHGKHFKVLVKEIQYHRVTYAVEHIDFVAVSDKASITVNVPIQIQGLADCVGVKLGGFMRQVIRALKVSCHLKDIPEQFTLDIRELQVSQVKRLSDIALPEGVRPLAKMNEVAVVIAKKA